MIVGISDKILAPWLEGKKHITASDEGEAIGIAGGYWLAKKRRATVFMSADGFCNALNPLTSWVMPEGIQMNLVISTGRLEPQHKVMTELLDSLLELLDYNTKKISVKIVRREP